MKRSLSSFKAFSNYGSPFSIVESIPFFSFENADDTKQIADHTKQIEDDTKQNCWMKTYGICGSPWVPILLILNTFQSKFFLFLKFFSIHSNFTFAYFILY
ncbi:hypothetical protein T10_4385, partial [Trichinella papuae]